MSISRRSMAGRIYQEREFRPKQISLGNPEQRSIRYPIKGDTSFEPSEYGRKHLSPKHSAIHSIIFNQNHQSLMQQKTEIIRKMSNNKKNIQTYLPVIENNKNRQFNQYLQEYLAKDNQMGKNHHSLISSNINSDPKLQSIDRIQRGRLYRQGSMHQVLNPYSQLTKSYESPQKLNNSGHFSGNNSSFIDLNSQNNKIGSKSPSQSLNIYNKDFPRLINPNNLNSIF